MSAPPAKRRRITPPAPEYPSSPSKINNAPSTPSRIPRPSFASPTKASIARYTPQLLTRPGSAGQRSLQTGHGARLVGGLDMDEHGLDKGQDDVARGSKSSAQEDMPAGQSHPVSKSAQTPSRTTAIDAPGSARPRTGTRAGRVGSPEKQLRSPVKHFGNENVAKEVDERIRAVEGENPFMRRGLRRSPPAASHGPAQEARPLQTSDATSSADAADSATTPVSHATIMNAQHSGVEKRELRTSQQSEDLPATQSQVSRRLGSPAVIGPRVGDNGKRPVSARSATPQHNGSQAQARGEEVQPLHAMATRSSPRRPPASQEVQTVPRKELSPATAAKTTATGPVLHPTPVQRGMKDPIVTTPLIDIHQSPSKRATRSSDQPAQKREEPSNKSETLQPIPQAKVTPSTHVQPTSAAQAKADKPQKKTREPLRMPDDPLLEKRRLRDQLLAEVEEARRDLTIVQSEDRMLADLKSKSAYFPAKDTAVILCRSTVPSQGKSLRPAPGILDFVNSFLPLMPPPKLRSKPDLALEPAPSHAPSLLDDPLPFLQVFSPLEFTADVRSVTTSELNSNDSSLIEGPQSLLHQYKIAARHPSGLFLSKLTMTIRPAREDASPSIHTIAVDTLDQAARPELGQFIEDKSSDLHVGGMDIGVICWAMGRWVEVAIQRANFWCTVQDDLLDTESRQRSLRRMKQAGKAALPSRSKGHKGEAPEAADAGDGALDKRRWSRKRLLTHMARTAMSIYDETSQTEIRLEWRMTFDWTGELESHISAVARVPESVLESDTRHALTNIPKIFDRLVSTKGPVYATMTVVALLMSRDA